MSKTYGIHDVQMRFNKETNELEILLPGNSSDPSKILKFPVGGGGGSGQGFPVAEGRQIVMRSDEIATQIETNSDNPPGVRSSGQDLEIGVDQAINTTATLFFEANGNPTNERAGFIALRCNGVRVATFAVDALGVTAMGFFDKAEPPLGVQMPAIDNATDLPSALTAINALLVGMRQFGYLAEA